VGKADLNIEDTDEDERKGVVEHEGMQHETLVVPVLKIMSRLKLHCHEIFRDILENRPATVQIY
jgi:hypothetical protein